MLEQLEESVLKEEVDIREWARAAQEQMDSN
jgi:hypothetical protein